jgi:formamidopyrimidine-DNA glycosylase
MLELPEAIVIAQQINDTLKGKRIARAIAAQSPHKFAWYTGDPASYHSRLAGKTIGNAIPVAGQVEIEAGDTVGGANLLLVISAAMHYHPAGEKPPKKHQLLLEFEDGSALSVTVQMWGAMFCFPKGEKGGFADYDLAKERPSPLADAFDRAYFDSLFDPDCGKLSAKEYLATKQRIPGLGNGVLQDILWVAKIHPRRKMATLSAEETTAMYDAVRSVLRQMADQGGRDTEKDLFDHLGGYKTVLSKNTVGTRCPDCGTIIAKEAYMGGSIYYCELCQKI